MRKDYDYMVLSIFLIVVIGIIAWAEIESRWRSKSDESPKLNPRKVKYVIALLLVLAVMLFFRYVTEVPLLFMLFTYAFLMMFCVGFFWLSLDNAKFRKWCKIYRVSSYALFMYWSIFLFEIFQRSMKFLTSNVKYYDGGYEAFDSLLQGIVGDVIVSLIMSSLFMLAVYLYKRYVSDIDN